MLGFRRLGRGTKPNIIDRALPNLPKNVLSVQALIKNDRCLAYGNSDIRKIKIVPDPAVLFVH